MSHADDGRTDRDRRRLIKMLAGLPLVGAAASAASEIFAAAAGPPAAAPAAAPTGAAIPGPAPSPRSAPSRPLLARARRDGLLDAQGKLDPAKLDDALGAAVARGAGEETPLAAMRHLFKPSDVVGLKVNTLAGAGLSPSPLLVARLCDWLQQAGVPARNIVVFDRSDRELKGAGYTINRDTGGVRVLGINDDWDWTPREWGPGGSCFAKVLVQDITALINVGVVKDHDLAGVSAGLKNWYGVIHNPNKHHDDGCAPYIPHLAAYAMIHDRLRLTVIDASSAQCHGGPARNPKWRWPYQSVLASTDPVAIDAFAWRTIEDRRKEVGLGTLAQDKREPKWIAGAAKLGLGEADVARITVAEV
jgi:uncharacterized protein (DUF362 family)